MKVHERFSIFSSLQEMHRSHATLNPLLLENSIASLLLITSKQPPLKNAVLSAMDIFIRKEPESVRPALVWKGICNFLINITYLYSFLK